MDASTIGLAGAFIIGLAHVFQPCEDKAIVAVFVMWTTKRVAKAIPPVVFYGLGMTLVNTCLGFIFSYAGSTFIDRYETPLRLVAGLVTIAFGFYMLSRFSHLHLGHPQEIPPATGNPGTPSTWRMLTFGLIRGIAFCPVELAILTWALSTGDVLRGTLMLFLFGLGTTISLIPAALVMGSLTVAAQKTSFGSWLPRIAPLAMILIGIFLVLSPLLGVEI